MKIIGCIILSVLTLIFPTPKLQRLCRKLSEDAFIISETNEGNKKSAAVRIMSFDFLN